MSTHSAPTATKTRIARTIFATAAVMAVASTGCVAVANSAAAAPTPAPAAASSAVGTVEHANYVYFAPKDGLKVSFTYDHHHRVSVGQPWGSVYSAPSFPTAPAEVVAQAGDHDSTMPAQWFTGNLAQRGSNPDAIATNSHDATAPRDLYFAYTGDLTINGHAYHVVIGESPAGAPVWAANQWSIGGTSTQVGTGTWSTVGILNRNLMPTEGTALVTPDGKYEIAVSNSYNTLDILPYHPGQG